MTPSEQFVYNLCRTSFLSFGRFPNPIGKRLDKELCDILIVCDPEIIIISVKEIPVRESGDYQVDSERRERNAMDESFAQFTAPNDLYNNRNTYY